MLRSQGLVLFTILIFISHVSLDQIIYSDGWIPMSRHDIYKQIRREWTQYPFYTHEKIFNLVPRKEDSQKNKQPTNADIKIKHNFVSLIGQRKSTNNETKENKQDTGRKAKKVFVPFQDIDNTIISPEIDINTESNTEKAGDNINITSAETSNTYEVFEEIETTTESVNNTEFNGYQYYPQNDKNQNLTLNFHKILSNYNINQDDKLKNYDLSLQRKAQNRLINNLHKVPIPYRYNNLNHLPVDPLLAVFLSNYGFYLPSLYGIKNNYHNLYGYLASNNIHNNKPFGSYKIFSDTDSWN